MNYVQTQSAPRANESTPDNMLCPQAFSLAAMQLASMGHSIKTRKDASRVRMGLA